MMRQKKQIKISDIVIPKYMPIFNDARHKHIILTSGRAGTKSSYAGVKANYQIVSDPAGSVVVLRKRHNKLRKTVYKEMIRGINRLQIDKNCFDIGKSPMEIRYKKHGTVIYFSGSDGIDDTKGIIDEDKPIKLVVLDELTEFFDDGEGEEELANIEATFVRGNKAGFQMIYLYNPPKNPNAPINLWCKKMEQRPDCIHIHTDYRDVPVDWLGEDLIASAKMMEQTDPKMYRWTWLGEPIGVDELIYYMYSEKNRYKPENERYRIIGIGVDYGQQNATTYQPFGLNLEKSRLEGLIEYYHSGRETGKQKSPSIYAKDFISLTDELHEKYKCSIFYVYIDPSAGGLAEEIRRQAMNCDYQITIKKAENDVKVGIQRVQKCMSYGILTVSPMQPKLDWELGLYEYEKKSIQKGKEEPVKENDHGCDAMRYCVMGLWTKIKYFMPRVDQGEGEED
nr:PBSX family phage terminase large subunit [uncultured Clostridium sp.]